jgi:hypothetical protein
MGTSKLGQKETRPWALVGGGIGLSAAEGKNMPPFRLDKEATEKQNAQDHENCDDDDFYQTHWAKSSVLKRHEWNTWRPDKSYFRSA